MYIRSTNIRISYIHFMSLQVAEANHNHSNERMLFHGTYSDTFNLLADYLKYMLTCDIYRQTPIEGDLNF